MGNFIYVFSTESRKKLKDAGFKELKADADNSVFVFVNNGETHFDLLPNDFIFSNVLTF